MKSILVVNGEGIGNIVEALPLVRTIEAAIGIAGIVDIAITHSSFAIPRGFFRGFSLYLPGDEIDEEKYEGKVVLTWAGKGNNVAPGLKTMNRISEQINRADRSEVGVYLRASEAIGIQKDKYRFDCEKMIAFSEPSKGFDVVMANGYNWRNTAGQWVVKSYRYHVELASMIVDSGLSVCSIGADREYIPGTENMTGRPLEETAGILARAKVVVSNDSGMYHLACALGVPTIVLFTFTSVAKNYDVRFHRTARVMGVELECRKDCQLTNRWMRCPCGTKCRNLPPEKVSEAVKEMMR